MRGRTRVKKRIFKNKHRNLKVEKDETMASLFTKISYVRDHLASIGVVTDEYDLLQTAIDGLLSARDTFLAVVNG